MWKEKANIGIIHVASHRLTDTQKPAIYISIDFQNRLG